MFVIDNRTMPRVLFVLLTITARSIKLHLFRDRHLNKNGPSGIISQGEAKNNENVRARERYANACGMIKKETIKAH